MRPLQQTTAGTMPTRTRADWERTRLLKLNTSCANDIRRSRTWQMHGTAATAN